MTLLAVDTRELRSFRFRFRIEELRSVIDNKTTDVSFCSSTSFNPIEREELRANLNKYQVVATSFSKNIVKFLFNNPNWIIIRSLLEGQSFVIKDNQKSNNFETNLKFFKMIVEQNDKFVLRLVLHNHQLYRRYYLKRLINSTTLNKITKEQITKPAIVPLFKLKQMLNYVVSNKISLIMATNYQHTPIK